MRTFGLDRLRIVSRSSHVGRASVGTLAVLLALSLLATASLISPSAGLAASPAPHWTVLSQAAPTQFHPGDSNDFYEIIAVNDGKRATAGPFTITDTLPKGVVVNDIKMMRQPTIVEDIEPECTQTTSPESVVTVTCTPKEGQPGEEEPMILPGDGQSLIVNINVQIPAEAAGTLENAIDVSGGGAPEASASNSTPVTALESAPVSFGASLVSDVTDAEGVDAQAGSHPFAFTTLLAFNVAAVNPNEKCNRNTTLSCAANNAQAKDIEVELPAGLVGNPTAVPYCKQAQFEQDTFRGCPANTQVGDVQLYFYGGGTALQYAPLYNIEPPPGQPGELGFSVSTLAHISMFFHVRSDGDYGITTDIGDINQFDPVRIAVLSLWGNPAESAHDSARESQYGECIAENGGCPSGVILPKPFLRLPTSCSSGSLPIPVAGDSWQRQPVESPPFAHLASGSIAGMSGCELLSFSPSISLATSSHQAGSAAGYDIGIDVPQNEELEGLGTPDVREIEVALPKGTVLSPSAANGLTACSDAQFGLKIRAKGECPSASKVGTVTVSTPLLASPLAGTVYVGAPECSPCSPAQAASGAMVRVFVEAEGSGIVIKQAGHTRIDQATGQLTTVFTEMPQDPVSEIALKLQPGPSAPLVNPASCGPAVATASVTPWSSITPSHISTPAVSIEGCSPGGFAPAFAAGRTTSARAGAFTDFSVRLSRQDGEQELGRVSVTTPSGLLGVLKSVEQCPAAQASAGTCSEASLIGSASIAVGAGSAPLTISGGKVYLTGPYAGRPFGLSIVTPTQAGPYVLTGNAGNGTEVVRASIAVDPHTSALTVESDPLPQALNGVPLDIRTITVDVNRAGFMFNPTSCVASAVTGSAASTTGTVAGLSSAFQSSDCALLSFKPKFSASTQGKTSKANGASLHVRVLSGAGQANIAQVKVDLPIELPSRLSTLQKSCIASVFAANPASCPASSVVGRATATTPVLKGALTGPAYIVSHAGAAFPDVDIVLQGEGITLILVGNTTIKKGITTSIFRTIPDAPVKSFDLVLPEGPHSILAAFGNLCTSKLNMPTLITGQNGRVVKQTTKISATGCPKPHGKRRKGH